MPDMSVDMVWLPDGTVDRQAGLTYIEGHTASQLESERTAEEIVVAGWREDLEADLASYESDQSVTAGDEPVVDAARLFVEAMTRVADPRSASRGLVSRTELSGGGVILAAGGDYGAGTAVSVATLYCASDVFPGVADAMGAVRPDQWVLRRADDG